MVKLKPRRLGKNFHLPAGLCFDPTDRASGFLRHWRQILQRRPLSSQACRPITSTYCRFERMSATSMESRGTWVSHRHKFGWQRSEGHPFKPSWETFAFRYPREMSSWAIQCSGISKCEWMELWTCVIFRGTRSFGIERRWYCPGWERWCLWLSKSPRNRIRSYCLWYLIEERYVRFEPGLKPRLNQLLVYNVRSPWRVSLSRRMWVGGGFICEQHLTQYSLQCRLYENNRTGASSLPANKLYSGASGPSQTWF